MTNELKRTRRTAEEKEAERRAKLCKCSASCTIPKAERKPEYHTDGQYCACLDREKRGGSYKCPVKGDSICRHIHLYRVETFQAPAGSPLAAFQAKNPLGAGASELDNMIARLCGPDPKKAKPNQWQNPANQTVQTFTENQPKGRGLRVLKR